MADILNPEKPEVISKVDIKESKEAGILTAEVVINAAYQKEVYEAIFKEKTKDVSIEGFRKGKAPREVVEPKVYSEVAKQMVEQIVYIASAELLTKLPKEYVVLDASTVEKVDFKVVESPITITFKVYYVKDVKLPDFSKYKVKSDAIKIDVTDEEVEASIKQVFEQWKLQQQQLKAKEQKGSETGKSTEPSSVKAKNDYKMDDEWVKKLGIPNVDSMSKLKDYVRNLLLKEKQAKTKQQLLEQTLDKIVDDLKIEVPSELVDKKVELEIERQRKEVEKYGITLEKYLEHYKKSLDELKKQLREQIEADYKQEVLRQLYIREFKVTLEKEDHAYMELAMGQLKVPPQALQDFNVLNMIARLALVFKVYDDIASKIGLGLVYKSLVPEHTHDHDHSTGSAANSQETVQAESKKGTTGKILIADE